MISGYDILAFTYADWRASWSTPHQIMTRLAPHNRVIFVDPTRSFLFWLKPKDPQGAGQWDGPSLQEVAPNIWVYHPPHVFAPVGLLPFPVARQSLRVNGRVLRGMVRKQMRQLGMRRRPIIWNFSPLHGKAVPYFQDRLTIYDICDEWANYVKHVSGKMVLGWLDQELCRDADIVFTGMESARSKRLHLNPETHVVHHGADYAHFSKAALEETQVPSDVAELPRPVIGFVGVMDPDRFDTELIEHLSRERPGWSIVLVGPPRRDMDLTRLQQLPNVYLTGNKAIEELPNYMKSMDVLLMPYKVNEATREIYPLKLHEYLATGKPVVSTAIPAVAVYARVVSIASAPGDFLNRVEAALAEGHNAPLFEARRAVARENSWEQRVEEKCAHIERLLEARKGSTDSRL